MLEADTNGPSVLDRALARAIAVDWEKVAWLAIFALALLTRLWQLGDRAMSHDESLHTYYSWQLFDRGNYRHDPMMHGPSLYHATALVYFLFGVSDLTARLFPVMAGLLLIASPLLLRKWIGRTGAIVTALVLVFSPTVMYYTRYIRHDIPVELFTALLLVSFFRYLDSGKGRWILLAAAAAALGVASAEMAYINAFVLASFVALALLAEWLGQRRSEWLSVVLGALGLGLLAFASVAMTGRLGDVQTKGVPLRLGMQFGFLVSGILLVYAGATALVARYRSDPGKGEPPPEGVLADLTPTRFFARYAQVGQSVLPLVSGVIVLALGLAMEAAARGTAGPGLAELMVRLGPIVKIIGVVLTAYGVAALVLGQLVRSLGRRANEVLVGVGIIAAATAVVLAKILRTAPPAGETGAVVVPIVPPAVTFGVLALGVIAVLYGVFGWLFEAYRERSLARRLGEAPLGAIGAALAVALVIYTLLFTTFFTQPDKITGFFDSIRYWLAQQDVIRGDQPWYYYAIFSPMYDFLPLILTLAAAVTYALSPRLRVARGDDNRSLDNPSPAARCFVPMLLTWTAGNFWVYSWAGEKMPWLLVHLAVPMAFVAGRFMADAFDAADWSAMRSRGWQLASLVILALVVLVTWFAKSPITSEVAAGATAGWLLGLPILALLLWGAYRLGSEMARRQAWVAIGLGLAALLAVFSFHFALQANFVNDELATEYIVYAHGTPDDKLVVETLLDMQERLGVDRPLTIAYDDEVSWPFTWYFRDSVFAQAHYMGKKPSAALSEDVALVGSPNYSGWEPYMRDRYNSIEYRRMWWPNEGYKGLTPSIIWHGLLDGKARRNALEILFQRKYTLDPQADVPEPKPLTDWYHHANMRLYVRKDLLEKLWPLAQVEPGWLSAVDTSAEAPPETKLAIEQVYEKGPDGKPLIAPKGIKVGPDGRLYVVDQGNYRIVVFNHDGTASEIIGAGDLATIGENGQDGSAWGVGVGPDGAVYVADTWNHRIVKYVGGQQVWAKGQFGQPASATEDPGLLYGPRDVAVGPDGNLYITDTGNKRIVVYGPDGTPLRAFGGSGVALGEFNEPTSLAFDPETGDMFVADLWNYRVQRFDKDMNALSEFPVDGWTSQEAAHKAYIAVGPGGVLAATDPAASQAWIFDYDGEVLGTLDVLGDERGMDQPIGVAIDAAGRVYIASSNSGLVTRYALPDVIKVPEAAAPPEVSPGEAGGEGAGAASPSPSGSPGAPEGEGALEPATPTESGSEPGAALRAPTATASVSAPLGPGLLTPTPAD